MASLNINEIRNYIENNRKQAMIFAGAGVVLIALLLFFVFRGPAEDETAGGFTPGTPGMPGATAANPFGGPPVPGGAPGPAGPGMTPGANAPGGGYMPGGPGPMPGGPGPMPSGPGPMPGGPMPGGPSPMPGGPSPMGGSSTDPFATGGQDLNAPAASTRKTKKKAEPSMYRFAGDPFTPLGTAKISPQRIAAIRRRLLAEQRAAETRAQLAQLPWVSIYRTGPAASAEQQPGGPGGPGGTQPQVTEVPVNRRTSGLLYGDRVLGVLETDGATTIVKPGDVVNSGGQRVRVQRIDRDGIVLRRMDSKQPAFRVPIKASEGMVPGAITGPPMPGGMPGGGYMPGGPGGYRGGPPMGPGGPPLPPL